MKKLLCLILAAATVAAMIPLALSVGSADSAFPFTDVPANEWFRPEVEFAWENGLMQGVSKTKFEPESPMTRAMFVTVLFRMSGEKAEFTDRFPDVKAADWFAESVGWAAKTGLVLGYPDGTFRPDVNITRQEVAATLVRYTDYVKMRIPGHSATSPEHFSDEGKIEDWAAGYVEILRKAGIFNGDNYKRFNPAANITRAEAATLLHNVLKVTANLWSGYVPDPDADGMAVYGARYLYWGGFALQGKLGEDLCLDAEYPYLSVYSDETYKDADHVSNLGETSIPLKSYEPLGTFGFSPTSVCADLTKTPFVKICYEYAGGEPGGIFPGYLSDRGGMIGSYRSSPLSFEPGPDDAGYKTAICDTSAAVAALGAVFGKDARDNVHVMIRPLDGTADGTLFRVRYIALFETKDAADAYRGEEHADYLKNYHPDESVTAEKLTDGEVDGYLAHMRDRIKEIKESPSSFTPEDAPEGATVWYVSSIHGDNKNDGLSPETPLADCDGLFRYVGSEESGTYLSKVKKGDFVFFERGSVFYPVRYFNHTIGTLLTRDGVTYSAYGDPSLPKPVFKGSFDFGGGCGDWQPTEWEDVWVLDLNKLVPEGKENFAREDGDVGKIIFNDGQYMGVHVIPNDTADPFGEGKKTRNMYEQGNCDEYFMSGGTTCLDPGDALRNNLEYIHDFSTGKLYLRCKWGNPSDVFDTVDVCRNSVIGWLSDHSRYDNLCFLYSAYCCADLGRESVVTWCEAGYGGGCIGSVGTGIGGYGPCESLTVDHCYIHDIEDGPMGTQETGDAEGVELNGVTLTNNVVTTAQNLVELFNTMRVEGPDGLGMNKIRNARVEGNIGAYIGYGYPRTVDSAAEGLAVHNWYYGEMVDCVYTNNTLICCEGSIMGAHVGSDNNPRGWLAYGNTYVLNPRICYILRGTDGTLFTNLNKSFYASYKMPYTDRYLSYLVSHGIEYGSKFYTYDTISEGEANRFFVTNSYYIERGIKPQ
ncbi:MAG: S-layer homology domain-containing protein [Clostridia bacterium]|nr:S-layer homology domain-containing protein [Clostridia bacterium]